MSQGQATRSTLTFSRVIHFMRTSCQCIPGGRLVLGLVQGSPQRFRQVNSRSSTPVVKKDVTRLFVSHVMVDGDDVYGWPCAAP